MTTSSLRAVIVDDERLAREKLRRHLLAVARPTVEIVAEADNGIDAIEAIERLKPDLAILDIQMPELSGLDVARHLTHSVPIIFATAYDAFAVKAFELNAVDYLLKPFDQTRLEAALQKITSTRSLPSRERFREILRDLVEQNQADYLDRIPTRIGDRIKLLDTPQILWFDTKDSVTFAHLPGRTFDVKYSLDELEQRLNPKNFFRSHRSSIINLTKVSEIVPWFNGQFKIKLLGDDQSEIFVSRSRAATFKDLLHL